VEAKKVFEKDRSVEKALPLLTGERSKSDRQFIRRQH
jgi:hypothetical protein